MKRKIVVFSDSREPASGKIGKGSGFRNLTGPIFQVFPVD